MPHVRGLFQDRPHAGRELAQYLSMYADREDAIVLAIPRGGVPVGYEVATSLHLPLDVFVVRKLGMPGHEEYAIGAIASGGVRVLNQEAVFSLFQGPEIVDTVAEKEQKELERREHLYRDDRPPVDVHGKVAIIVDDGLATGSTMRAAVAALHERGAGKIIVAVPVAPPETCDVLRMEADEVICPMEPENFMAVGQFYERFFQTSDEEVRDLLARAAEEREREKGD